MAAGGAYTAKEKGQLLGPGRGCLSGRCWWLQGGQQGSGRTGAFWVFLGFFYCLDGPKVWGPPQLR